MEGARGVATDLRLGASLRRAREVRGLSELQAARATGVRRRRIAAFEHGDATPSDAELSSFARAYMVSVDELIPAGHDFAVVGIDAGSAVRGDEARDALLREYVSMVLQLRGGSGLQPSSLRHDDLRELAAALGGSADAIEAKLVDLLDADPTTARTARVSLFPERDS